MTRWQHLRRHTFLGWLQLRYNPTRFAVAIAGIAFADLLMFMQLGVLGALFSTSVLPYQYFDADVILVSPEARDLANSGTFPRVRLYQSLQLPAVATARPLYISFLDWKAPITGQRLTMAIIGVDPDQPAFDTPEIERQKAALKLDDTVLIDRLSRGDSRAMLAALDSGQHPTAEINRRTLHVFGDFRLGASFAQDGTIVGSSTTFLHLFPQRDAGSLTLGMLKLVPGADAQAVADKLSQRLPNDVRAYTKTGFIEYGKEYTQHTQPISFIFYIGTAMGFAVGFTMVYQVLSTDVADHMAEYATFKAMGYTDLWLASVIAEEAVILAITGFVPGLGASAALYGLIHFGTALPIEMPPSRIFGVFTLTVALCVVSGILAARKLRSADPAEIFA